MIQAKIVRDAEHGDIHLPAEYLPVVDTREMQRLRGIRQLGTAFPVYPSAQHTRFEHCLGAFHLTTRLIDRLRRNHRADPDSAADLTPAEERIAHLTALVHDITHIPYGHSIEDQDGLLPRHDVPERVHQVLGRGEIAEVLERLGARVEVEHCLVKPGDSPTLRPGVHELTSENVCADMLDYLRRDAFFTGLRLTYDDRILDSLKLDPETGHIYVDLTKHQMNREDILSELLNLFRIRYICSERIYYHHAKVASGALLSRAVELCLLAGLEAADLDPLTDADLPHLLKTFAARCRDRDPRLRAVPRLLDRFVNRKLLKRCFVAGVAGHETIQDELVRRFVDNQPARIEVETEIARSLAIDDPAEVIVYCPKKTMQLKEASVLVRRAGRPLAPLDDYADELPMLGQMLRDYRYLWKLYVFVPPRTRDEMEKAGRVAEGVLREYFPTLRNAYRP
jgi:HD superfamily phosphohydrolase